MAKELVDGRPVWLRKTKTGWAVKWGWTLIGHYADIQDALKEICGLFEVAGCK